MSRSSEISVWKLTPSFVSIHVQTIKSTEQLKNIDKSTDVTFFWIVLAAGFASGILTGMIENGENVSTFVSLLASLLGMAITAINLIMNIKLSQRFGHGVLFGLGLMFLSPLFTMILGLGESEYLGNPEEGLSSRRLFYV